MDTEPQAISPLRRYVPLVCWLMAVATLLLIPLKIVSYGFVPGGDMRRHVAKAFTEKQYPQIVVLRPGYTVDHSPGWEWLLRVLHKGIHWETDALVAFSIISMMLFVLLAGLPWLRRPEAWLGALLAQLLAVPEFMTRLTQARPYLLTEGVLIAVLFAWTRTRLEKTCWQKFALTTIAIAVSVWMHGSWYLWVLPIGAFFLARWWREGVGLTVCWIVGVAVGALLTGRPLGFLMTNFLMAADVIREGVPQWMLVGEFQPSAGEFTTLVLLAIVFLCRREANHNLLRSPLVWMIAIGWILGLRADRTWADWGVPAVLVWLAMQFEAIMEGWWNDVSFKRLAVGGLIALPLFFQSTSDLDRRYTLSLEDVFLDASDASLQGWLPEDGGIFYSADMGLFYNTFYRNPRAPWRYLLGFEPALMPDEDRRTFRQIQRSHGAPVAYEPWIDKMHPADRLEISSPFQPGLPRLEWHHAAGNIWIGRLPRTTAQ
jgi:hypothetical protein